MSTTVTQKLELPANSAAPATAPLALTPDQIELVAAGLYAGPPVPLPSPVYPSGPPRGYF
jgi:hypothetical protein